MQYKDMLGQEIKPGSYIIYAAVDDRSGVLRIGKVTELKVRKDDSGWRSKEIPTVQAKALSYNYDGSFARHDRVVTLGFLTRMTVVDDSMLPDAVKQMLEE